jgi:hypothetical protein
MVQALSRMRHLVIRLSRAAYVVIRSAARESWRRHERPAQLMRRLQALPLGMAGAAGAIAGIAESHRIGLWGVGRCGGIPSLTCSPAMRQRSNAGHGGAVLVDPRPSPGAYGLEKAQEVGRMATAYSLNDLQKVTKQNAGYAASILLGWAKQHPEAIWRVS